MRKTTLLGIGGLSFFILACGGSGLSDAGGTLLEFNTVIFSSTGANVEPGIVPLLNAQVRQIPQLQGLKACVGDENNNGRCDDSEGSCQTCAEVPVGTSCDSGDFRSVCCANVDVCFGQPTEFTITFNFKSIPLFDARGGSLPRPTSPVIIQDYTATFSYSPGCPTGLPLLDSRTLLVYVSEPPQGGESTAQINITYSTQPWLNSVGIFNACMTNTQINFRIPPTFTSSVCNVNGMYNFTVMEQYSGKRKTITVPVSMQIIPSSGECIP